MVIELKELLRKIDCSLIVFNSQICRVVTHNIFIAFTTELSGFHQYLTANKKVFQIKSKSKKFLSTLLCH